MNEWAAITRAEKTSIELLTNNMDSYLYLSILERNIIKVGGKKNLLVWNNASYHISSNVKEFYIKNVIKRIE